MPDLRATVTISQRAEGRLVEAMLTPDAVEELLTQRRVEFRLGDDDAEFDDRTAKREDDFDNPPEVVRLYLTVVDDLQSGLEPADG